MGPSKRARFGRRCAEKNVLEVLKSILVPPKGPDLGAKCAEKYVPMSPSKSEILWVPIFNNDQKNLKLAPLDFPRLQVPKVLH